MLQPRPIRLPRPPTRSTTTTASAIADPYRPLEDSDAPASRAWIEAQNALTERVLGEVPGATADPRAAGRAVGLPASRRAVASRRPLVPAAQHRPPGPGRPVDGRRARCDRPRRCSIPNALSDDGTTAAVGHRGLARAASSSPTPSATPAPTGGPGPSATSRPARTCPIGSPWSKFASAAWTHDDAGFFYGRYPEPPADAAYDAPNRDMELRYHRLGTDAGGRPVVFATPDEPEWGFEPEVSDDGRLLVVTIWRGTDPENRIYVADLADGVEAASVRPLLDAADARYEPIAAIDRHALPAAPTATRRSAASIGVDVDDPGELARGHPGGRRRPRARPARRRAAGGRLPPRCPPSARDLRARRAPRRGRRAAGHRHDRRRSPADAKTPSCS